jgi:hypothetical protein
MVNARHFSVVLPAFNFTTSQLLLSEQLGGGTLCDRFATDKRMLLLQTGSE